MGIIEELGDLGIKEFEVGDKVVSNGPHAEVVCVPRNLCVRLPERRVNSYSLSVNSKEGQITNNESTNNYISFEEAAFTVVGAIGLQGVRLAQPTLGENFVVTGFGLVGQLAVQLLMAHVCWVLGIDFDGDKCALACQFGDEVVDPSRGEGPVEAAIAFSGRKGVAVE